MKRGWRPLGILLLVVTILWFITGPLRSSGSSNTSDSSFWNRSPAPTAAPTGGAPSPRVSSTTSPGGTGSTDSTRRGEGGGLFGTVEDAKRRWEQARSDSSQSAPRQGWSWPGTNSGASSGSGSGSTSDSLWSRGSGSADSGASDAGSQAARSQAAGEQRGAQVPADADRIMLILDASGSMARRDNDGGTSMEAAQHATANALESLPEGTPVGLRVFGSRVDGHGRPTPAACADTVLVQPIAPLNRRQMTNAVFSFAPLGETPIARSIDAAVRDLGPTGNRAILLVTDGEESCSPNPCQAVTDARDAGVDVRVDIVGLRVDNRARDQLRCIARATNGYYSEARTDRELGGTLQAALDRLRDQTARGAAGSTAANTSLRAANGEVAQPSTGSLGGREAAAAALAFLLLAALFSGSSARRR